MKKILLLMLILTSQIYATEEEKPFYFGTKTTSGIGLSAGILSGFGLAYRQFLTEQIGIHLVAPGTGSIKSLSLQGLIRFPSSNLYFIGGLSRITWTSSERFRYVGAGLGIEFAITTTPNLGLSPELPIIYATGGRRDGYFPFPNANVLWHF